MAKTDRMNGREPTGPTQPDIKRLFARSGNRCAFPKCKTAIVHGDTVVGKVCHIKAASMGGPRYDVHQTAAERHGYDNLILLCANHHTIIDDDEEAYTIERLTKMKEDHEKHSEQMTDDMVDSAVSLLNQSVTTMNQSGGIAAHTIKAQVININSAQPSPVVPASPLSFPAAAPKGGQARFRSAVDPLGLRLNPHPWLGGGETDISLSSGPAVWLRLMPTSNPKKKWAPHELREYVIQNNRLNLTPLPIFHSTNSHYLRAEDGFGVFYAGLSPDASETGTIAFAFETGEIWAVDTLLLTFDPTKIFSGEIVKACINGLQSYGRFLNSLGIEAPYHWIAGITGIKDRYIYWPTQADLMDIIMPGRNNPRCLSNEIIVSGEYDGQQSPMHVLQPFFKEIFNKCGMALPDVFKK